jgi:hypothetical protein
VKRIAYAVGVALGLLDSLRIPILATVITLLVVEICCRSMRL